MKRGHQEVGRDEGGRRGRCGNGGTYLMDDAAAASASVSKGKSLKKEEEAMMLVQDDGDDELLAALGYKVRSSSMADVAQKLEQLEMAMAVGDGSAFAGFRNGSIAGGGLVMDTDSSVLTNLAAETVHYNPSDLNSWLENMLSELNVPLLPPPSPSTAAECSTMQIIDFSSPTTNFDNLTAIIPAASREKKRIKPSAPPTSSSTSTPLPPPTCLPPSQLPVSLVPVVLVEDSQGAGICLVHALLACADAIQQENLLLAETLVKQITVLTTSQGGAMRKVATYFAEALARRIYQIHPTPSPTPQESLSPDLLEMHFYEACPYLKFAHFTANQAILEAFVGKSHVHVIDFGMKQGLQWPALMQALALRPGGPPVFRLTGVGFPQPNSPNAIQEVGWKLAEFAESLEIKFDYRGLIVNSLVDLEPFMFDTADDHATTAINCILEFHSLLASPRSIEKVLETTKALKPSILTLVEQEAKHNGLVFIDRFTEALHYYSTMFDSLEGDGTTTTAIDSKMGMEGQDLVMAEVYVGKQIFDVVACEGTERKERHETAEQWKARMSFAGFEILPLGSNAYKQASLLLEHFAGGDGYRVEEKDGCLMLGWHTRPLFTTSAWRLASSSAPPPPPPGVTVEGHGSCRR